MGLTTYKFISSVILIFIIANLITIINKQNVMVIALALVFIGIALKSILTIKAHKYDSTR